MKYPQSFCLDVAVPKAPVGCARTYGVASGTFGKRGSGQDRHDDDARHSRPITYLLWCKTRKDTVQYTARNGYLPSGYSRWVFGASLLIFQSSQVKITKPRKSSIQVKSNLQRRGACCAERSVPPPPKQPWTEEQQ